jgi:hypothetical protein
MDKLIKTKAQYQELLNSGKIKDQKRRENIVQNIISIDKQITQLSPVKTGNDIGSPDPKKVALDPKHTKLRQFKSRKKKKVLPELSVPEQRLKSLQEIFHFYSR